MNAQRFVFGILICWPLMAGASCVSPAQQSGLWWGIYFDQDMFIPGGNEDRDYTMGIALEFFEEDGAFYLLDGVVRRFGELLEEAQIKGLLNVERDERSGGYIVRRAD